MKLILHIGRPKTGTSTLQATLSGRARLLREAGYLYPRIGHVTHHKHITFLLPCLAPSPKHEGMPPEDLRSRGEAGLGDVKRQIDRHRPHTVILSSEYLFRPMTGADVDILTDYLRQICDDIAVVAYLRDPVSAFASGLAQRLKTNHLLPDGIRPADYVAPIAAFRRRHKVYAHRFDRASLIGGDIVTDFMTRYVEGVPPGPADSDTNRSPGAEGIKLLWLYRRTFAADRAGTYGDDLKAFYGRILAAEDTLGRSRKVVVLPRVADHLYGLFLPQHDYLKAHDGIDFLGDRVVGVPSEPLPPPQCLEDLFDVSQDRFCALAAEVARTWTDGPMPVLD